MTKLTDFVVFDKLKVHEIKVEPKRVRATYTLEYNGKNESAELIYSYDETFFKPGAYQDMNLASMMLAQVALNYGLFCKVIEFDGVYDNVDKSFLKKFVENTSREIITNKLLIDNEFIKPEYKNLRLEKQEKYIAARIEFTNSAYKYLKPVSVAGERPNYEHYAILSSGGKDSLLTYGLVGEIGIPHPVFINESGRHWFTAVNSYRYYKKNEPNTVKPWCNSDRLFNWMVKRMPFIKENYTSIRADIYPIRLWTVAVFLFGVLPVVRKRNIGNILIGNEFDTTETSVVGDIKHYNGLFDQSRYFDEALTRYFADKKWYIRQFSMLRTLSELLIMKILVKRYPELQKEQISCHAAHEKDNRMYPCGKCEKCRRIIGMLKALGEDPKRCGYTDEQVSHGLAQLEQKSVKQIGTDAQHLYYLLTRSENIQSNAFTESLAKPHNEIMQLRFHPERSRLSDLPYYAIKPLFSILAEYAEGTVEYKKRQWEIVELNNLIEKHFNNSGEKELK